MVCPSDPQLDGAGSAYVYNYGYGSNYGVSNGTPGYFVNNTSAYRVLANGVFGFDYPNVPANWRSNSLNYVSAKDGATQTVMVSENIDAGAWTDLEPTLVGFSWQDDISKLSTISINRIKGTSINQANPNLSHDYARPSSNHPSVVNVAFCDRHVSTINENINYVVWAQLMAPWGVQTLNDSGNPPTSIRGPNGEYLRDYVFNDSDAN